MNISKVLNISENKDTATLNISGYIGLPASWQHEDSDGMVNTKDDLRAELKAIEDLRAKKIIINIDSMGGSVDHAIAIYNILKSKKTELEVNYIGISASSGTIIGSVAKLENVNVYNNVAILVHEARIGTSGTISNLQETIDELKTINDLIAQTYSNLNGKSKEENLKIMQENNGEGRFLTPDEAKALGFVGNILNENSEITNKKDYTNCIGECHIDKLNKFTNKTENMGIFSKKQEAVLNTLNFGDKTLIFGELKNGEDVKISGETENFTGDFDYENKKIFVEDGVITNIVEISETEKELEILKAENDALKTKVSDIENSTNVEEVNIEIEKLKEENAKMQEVIAKAKLQISNPSIPNKEFKNDKQDVIENDEIKAYKRQKAIDEYNANKQKK